MSLRLGAVVLAVVLALLPFAAAPVRAAQGDQGLQDGWAIDDAGNTSGYHLLSDQLGAMQQAGAGWVRINFRLGGCFSDWTTVGCNGRTAVQAYAQVVTNARARNLKVLGLVAGEAWRGGQADWTANNAENGGTDGGNPYIRAFAQDAAGVLARAFNGANGPLVDAWEVWNEPNAWSASPAPGVYSGGSFVYPSNFVQLLAQSHAAIKAANPSAPVIAGGMFGHDTNVRVRGNLGTYKPRSGGTGCPSTVATSGATYLLQTAYQAFKATGYVGRAYWYRLQDLPPTSDYKACSTPTTP